MFGTGPVVQSQRARCPASLCLQVWTSRRLFRGNWWTPRCGFCGNRWTWRCDSNTHWWTWRCVLGIYQGPSHRRFCPRTSQFSASAIRVRVSGKVSVSKNSVSKGIPLVKKSEPTGKHESCERCYFSKPLRSRETSRRSNPSAPGSGCSRRNRFRKCSRAK